MVRHLRGQHAPPALTNAQRKLVESSLLILGEAADAKDAAYLARELVQASLPHSNPGDIPLWTRRNGEVTLAIQPGVNIRTGKSYGYPYGSIPRLLLFWITTEAIRVRSRRLELGHSLNGFMADLGLNPDTGGGKRGDAKRLRDQMERLFRSRFSLERYEITEEQTSNGWIDMQVASKGPGGWTTAEVPANCAARWRHARRETKKSRENGEMAYGARISRQLQAVTALLENSDRKPA